MECWRSQWRAMRLVAGVELSGIGVLCGLWMALNLSPILSVGPLAAGIFVLMYLVADDLVPGASQAATGIMKLTVALVFFGWSLLAFWSVLTRTLI